MAKRKRLSPATLSDPAPDLETKSWSPSRPPIAQVAGDAAAQAALAELAEDVKTARASGRLVQNLELSQITADHLLRDRMVNDPDEMAALKASLRTRGQQTPIEVVELEPNRFGLISGWRRLTALSELFRETGEPRFASVLALIKPVQTVSDSYVAMVEENEIRANLSFYERAHLASEAARLGVYPSAAQAVQALFANATPARRSKIKSFVRLHQALGDVLQFPVAIPERLGLALVRALEDDEGFAPRLTAALDKAAPGDAIAEREVLERALRARPGAGAPKAVLLRSVQIGNVKLDAKAGRVVLSGQGVSEELITALEVWLSHAK